MSATANSESSLQASHGWFSGVRSWWRMLVICLEERLAYRTDFALGTVMRFLPIVTQVFLWTAVFAASSRTDIAGYSRDNIVAILPFAAVLFFCRGYFPPAPDGLTIAAYILSLLLSFLLGFFLEATLGMIGFWFLEVSSIIFAYMLFQYLLSGHMFPIDMLADIPTGLAGVSLADIVRLLPFEYTAYFPAAVWLGKITGWELVRGLLVEIVWLVVMIGVCRFVWWRGTKRYSGFGG